MAKKKINWKEKRCPKCGGTIDRFGTCRKCGRPWSEKLEEGEAAIGLEEGEQYESSMRIPDKTKPKKNRFTKSGVKHEQPFSEDLPERFDKWLISEKDTEPEIINKRSLMHLDTRRLYNQMGLSVRAQESAKAALYWLSQLYNILDQREQEAVAPALLRLKSAFELTAIVRRSKVIQAAKMEKEVEAAIKSARKARLAMAAKALKDKKEGNKVAPLETDTDTLPIDQAALMEEVTKNIVKLEKSKKKTPKVPPEDFERIQDSE